MHAYKIKAATRRAVVSVRAIVERGGPLAVAALVLGATSAAAFTGVFSGIASADALNPLTERSLRLTSSAPGFVSTDGSGNSTYAQPGQGANGQKTGELFTFKVSTDSSASGTNAPIKAFTLQYCTSAAGVCTSPGNNSGGAWTSGTTFAARGSDTTTTSDLKLVYDTATAECGIDYVITVGVTPVDCDANSDGTDDWTLAVKNVENPLNQSLSVRTGTDNFATLSNPNSTIQPTAGTQIAIKFNASSDQYITNPGAGAFFVRLNTYNTEDDTHHMPNDSTATDGYLVDGGVTVANVMTDSIWIQTKVLETMSFSVGKADPNTTSNNGACVPITDTTPLMMGAADQENSLSPQTAYDAYSYWRLSSNSSAGASVYYSGATLSNTVGDQIDEIGTTRSKSHVGSEQFGLAMDTLYENVTYDAGFAASAAASPSDEIFLPTLNPLAAETAYAKGDGTITNNGTAEFAFDADANDEAALLAANSTQVLVCSTGRMRYLANIAGYTPAGIYTTKINYLAAPQY